MKKNFRLGWAVLCAACIVMLASCAKNKPETPKLIKLATSSTLGTYLTDKDNRALYFFANDFNGQNSCAGACEAVWPYFNVDNLTQEQLGDTLKLSDFGSITAANGKKQVTYKSWPLYYYAPAVNGVNTPEGSGTTNGDGVGGVWFVAKPDYSIMLANTQLIGHDGKNYVAPAYTEGTGKAVYFTDATGNTLYIFKPDKFNKNTYTKSDFSNNALWPIYETTSVVVPSVLDKTLFTSIDVFGRKQLTYNGWPLYHFQQDAGNRGSNKGVSFPSPGIWPVAQKATPVATP